MVCSDRKGKEKNKTSVLRKIKYPHTNDQCTEWLEYESKTIFPPAVIVLYFVHTGIETHIKPHCFENNMLETCSDLSCPPRTPLYEIWRTALCINK